MRLALRLLSASVLAQLVVLVATAWCAARSNPEQFGSYGLVSSIAFALSSVNTLAAETRLAVVDEARAEALWVAATFFCLVSSLSLLMVGSLLALHDRHAGAIVIFSGWAAWALGRQQLLIALVLRAQHQGHLATNRLVQAGANALLIVGLLLVTGSGFVALTAAWFLSVEIGNVDLRRSLGRANRQFSWPLRSDWRELHAEVEAQPVSNLLAGTVGSFPMFTLPLLGAPDVAGAWALASRVLQPLVNTTTSALQPIYYGHAAALVRDRLWAELRGWHSRWTVHLTLAALPVAVACASLIGTLLPMIGSAWEVARIMAIPGAATFAGFFAWLPMSQTLVLLGEVRIQFVWTVLRFLVCAAPFAIWRADPATAVLAWSIVVTVASGVHVFVQRLELPRAAASGREGGAS